MFCMYLTSQPPSLHTVFHDVQLHYSLYYVFTPTQHNVNMENLARSNENSAESEKWQFKRIRL